MTSSRTPGLTITGIALIVLPLLALLLKLPSFGWLMVILMFGPVILLILGYALQIVIAAQGFLSSRAVFAKGPARKRATVAAWLTSVAVVVLGVFMPDGGDSGYGSTLQVWLGAYSSDYETAQALHLAGGGVDHGPEPQAPRPARGGRALILPALNLPAV